MANHLDHVADGSLIIVTGNAHENIRVSYLLNPFAAVCPEGRMETHESADPPFFLFFRFCMQSVKNIKRFRKILIRNAPYALIYRKAVARETVTAALFSAKGGVVWCPLKKRGTARDGGRFFLCMYPMSGKEVCEI
jgi:hypothetical protein